MTMYKESRKFFRLSFVPRWVILPTHQKQSVTDHVARVVKLCEVLLEKHQLGPNFLNDKDFQLSVYRLALNHDNDEAFTGDTPSPAKQPKDYSTLDAVHCVVKAADIMDTIIFLKTEMRMGNSFGIREVLICQEEELYYLLRYSDLTSHLVLGKPEKLDNSVNSEIRLAHRSKETLMVICSMIAYNEKAPHPFMEKE